MEAGESGIEALAGMNLGGIEAFVGFHPVRERACALQLGCANAEGAEECSVGALLIIS